MLAERNPQFQPTITKLRELSADEKARQAYERREKARRDESMRIRHAKNEGHDEGRIAEKNDTILNAILMGMDNDSIIKLTGSTHDKIDTLRKNPKQP